MLYQREKAVAYAQRWAYHRNPEYDDFSRMGGDCTNFISQCLHAGGAPMQYEPTFGWYYYSTYERAPAWTGVEFLYRFLRDNRGTGPYAVETNLQGLNIGDVIQLSFEEGTFGHSLLVVDTGNRQGADQILVSTHTFDAFNRPLSTYTALKQRYLKIYARG